MLRGNGTDKKRKWALLGLLPPLTHWYLAAERSLPCTFLGESIYQLYHSKDRKKITCCGRKGGYLDLISGSSSMLQTIEIISMSVPLWTCWWGSCSQEDFGFFPACKLAAGFCEVILNMLIVSGALHPVKISVLKLLSLPGDGCISEMLETDSKYSFSTMLPWHLSADCFFLTSSCPCLPAWLGPHWTSAGQFGKNQHSISVQVCRAQSQGCLAEGLRILAEGKAGNISFYLCTTLCVTENLHSWALWLFLGLQGHKRCFTQTLPLPSGAWGHLFFFFFPHVFYLMHHTGPQMGLPSARATYLKRKAHREQSRFPCLSWEWRKKNHFSWLQPAFFHSNEPSAHTLLKANWTRQMYMRSPYSSPRQSLGAASPSPADRIAGQIAGPQSQHPWQRNGFLSFIFLNAAHILSPLSHSTGVLRGSGIGSPLGILINQSLACPTLVCQSVGMGIEGKQQRANKGDKMICSN